MVGGVVASLRLVAHPPVIMMLHQMWVGPEMPAWIPPLIETWLTLHAHWDYRLWTEPPSLHNQQLWDDAEELSSAPWQFRSDVARYEILHRFGGVWVDVDMECLRPIDDLVAPAFLGWEVQGRWANNAIMGAEPGHPFLAEAIDHLPRSAMRKGSNAMKSGPRFITPIAKRHQVTIYDQGIFYPYAHNELHRSGEHFPDAYTVHHWHNQRRLREMPL